jgi:hypothetical protein
MTHEVFISYSHHDKAIADGVCANLEQAGIRCWIAPRDIAPGYDWPTAISDAIDHSRVLVLIFSSRSNSSQDVGRELILAANNNCIIVPFKIEDVAPEPGKKYYLARTHWLDAMDPPTQEQVDKLVSCVRSLLVEAGVELPPMSFPAKPIPTKVIKSPPAVFPGESAPLEEKPQVASATSQPVQTSPKKPPSRLRIVVAYMLVVIVLVIGIFLLLVTILGLPALTTFFSSHPTPTSTTTKSSPPHVTATLTTRPTPTATSLPSWVSDFAQPILDAIDGLPPTFQDDFGLSSAGWQLNTWCAEQMKYQEEQLLVPECSKLSHSGLEYPDFVLE